MPSASCASWTCSGNRRRKQSASMDTYTYTYVPLQTPRHGTGELYVGLAESGPSPVTSRPQFRRTARTILENPTSREGFCYRLKHRNKVPSSSASSGSLSPSPRTNTRGRRHLLPDHDGQPRRPQPCRQPHDRPLRRSCRRKPSLPVASIHPPSSSLCLLTPISICLV